MKIPRAHQERAFTMLRTSLARGNRRPMLRAPTGAGKTFIAAMIRWRTGRSRFR
jgi:superfamily II DNA or RNA helicase